MRKSRRITKTSNATSAGTRPELRYDEGERKWWAAGIVIKHFRQPAVLMEPILIACEKSGWAQKILDPLPPLENDADVVKAKRRLHEAIRRLNRNQHPAAVRFHGDGTGKQIILEILTGRQRIARPASTRKKRTKLRGK